MKKINYKGINILISLLIVYVLYLLRDLWIGVFFRVLAVLKPFIVAFAIAYALFPFEKWLESKKIPKPLAVSIIVLIIVLFIVVIIYSLIPIFTEQLVTFFSSLITFVSDIGNKFDIKIDPIKSSLIDAFNKLSKDIGFL